MDDLSVVIAAAARGVTVSSASVLLRESARATTRVRSAEWACPLPSNTLASSVAGVARRGEAVTRGFELMTAMPSRSAAVLSGSPPALTMRPTRGLAKSRSETTDQARLSREVLRARPSISSTRSEAATARAVRIRPGEPPPFPGGTTSPRRGPLLPPP